MTKNKQLLVLTLLLFISGITALIFQTLWVKQLGIVIGVDIYSTSIVISGFFTGLGVGNYYLGKYIERSSNPLKVYFNLEILTAISSAVISLLLFYTESTYVQIEAVIGKLAYIIPWLLIALPAFFMSGTFLALIKYYNPSKNKSGKSIGYLYGANTAGAILGALSTPFIVIPIFGVVGAGLFTACINLLLGAYVYFFMLNKDTPLSTDTSKNSKNSGFHIGYILYGITGFIGISQEILWGQIIVQFQNTRTYAFATMLAIYLLGLALGNLIMGKYVDKIKNLWKTFGLLTFGSIFCTLFSIGILGSWTLEYQVEFGNSIYDLYSSKGAMMMGRFLFISSFFILIPTTFMGAIFPVITQLVSKGNHLSEVSGKLLAWNTIGGVLGSLVTGFILFPTLGVIYTLFLLLALSIGVSFAAFYQTSSTKKYAPSFALGLLFIAFIPNTKFIDLLLEKETGDIVYFKEGIGNTVAVIEQGEGDRIFRRLYIQGVSNTGDVFPSLRYMRLQSFIPLITFNGKPKSALVVGLGTGITAGALLKFPELEERAVVELLPEVVEATNKFVGNYQLAQDENINIFVDDGRHKLMKETRTYDLITLEPPPPTAVGVNNLYSKDFYELCRSRLTTNGMMAQWWPITTQTVAASESLVKAILEVFPYANLWTTEMHEMLIIGSMQPLTLDLELIRKRLAYPDVKKALNEVGIHNEAQFLSTYVMGRGGLHVFSRNAEPVSDNHPILEYDGWVNKSILTEILPQLLDAQENIPNLSEGLKNEVDYERENLHRFYYAGMASYVGRRDVWSMLLTDLYKYDDKNAYYNWYDPK
ncbi:fused MFS/spermidine synthase [Flammeovirga kamogawensis]|uniref:Fused MFS/spermidine synthase n=1 Tax=Flammeovirga kamogawensis TaxID=373891 RepID=A0ABX8H073_9BACT|nr:fused MFS/spermidine synthase [Flammeovirga kamogawensis]MBB6459327.1 putative membrane-bound spermidine synthase [Flammeovirga kamogawensis]QWG08886.1 fused MFS/spermidine synthase [Flammeovirga kamogawensis]TRX67176.1 spermidine synthase [Flammeovirga kamogawensis]